MKRVGDQSTLDVFRCSGVLQRRSELMRGCVFTAAECRCRFHFTIYLGEFIRQRATGRVWQCRRCSVGNWEEEEWGEVCHSSDAMRVGDKRLTPFERTEERDRCVSFSFHDSIRTSLSPRLEIWLNFNFFFVFLLSFLIFDQASFRGVRSRKENG